MNASTDRNDPFLHGGKIEFICFAVARLTKHCHSRTTNKKKERGGEETGVREKKKKKRRKVKKKRKG